MLNTLWKDAPNGIPGNDDLGAMSSWYVWAAMGVYPGIPGRAELFLTAPLFTRIVIHRGNEKPVVIMAPQAGPSAPYVQSLRVDGKAMTRAWLPQSFVAAGGTLDFVVGPNPSMSWGSAPEDIPPSFGPRR